MTTSLKFPLLALAIFATIAFLAAFTQASVKQPDTSQNSSVNSQDLVTQTQNFVFFYTKAYSNLSRTQVTVPYSFEGTPPILFIGFTAKDQSNRQVYLISHPQIMGLPWYPLQKDQFTLYQKQPTFNSVDDFINNPPDISQVAVDPGVQTLTTRFDQATTTEGPLDLDKINYILTTFVPSTEKDGVYYYQNIIDATGAAINSGNQIEWFIKNPGADADHPYQLGNIKIDYLQ